MSTLKAANIQSTTTGAPTFKTSTGTEIGQLAKAWVTFGGTGTVAIIEDFNVTSVTDEDQGAYTVNLTNAMGNANYAVATCLQYDSNQTATTAGSAQQLELARVSRTTSSFGLICCIYTGTLYDAESIFAVVFGP